MGCGFSSSRRFGPTCNADELRGKVVSIADEDTVKVLNREKVQNKIRLQGFAAPEKLQAFGADISKETSRRWVEEIEKLRMN